MVIRDVTPEIATFSLPFKRFGRINIGGRATVVRLASGGLAAFSPVALTDAVKAKVSSMGTVKWIIAPALEHHIFLDDWHKQFPDAKLIGPYELKAKREKSGKPLPFAHLWKKDEAPSVDADFDQEFEYTYVYAHPNKELVFNHKPTKTLIQADLMFALPAKEQYSKTDVDPSGGILTKLFIYLNNPYANPPTGQRRFLWYGMSSGDRPAFNRSIRTIDAYDFQRIIPAHGDCIESGAKQLFRTVFKWHLDSQ